MTKLFDIFPEALFQDCIEKGLVRQAFHPSKPYAILNYTEKAQYEGEWNECTLACRGLIFNHLTMEVIARPFKKFFNYGDSMAQIDLGPICVTDKMDGCFVRNTTLNLWGGGTITIGEVVKNKLNPILVGMNENGDLVPSKVINWHHNGPKDIWLDLEIDCLVSRNSGLGKYKNVMRVTPNHSIYVNGKYTLVKDIQVGDSVITQVLKPSDEVIKLVKDSLLGDGCVLLSKTKPTQAKYQECHCIEQLPYVESLRIAMGTCGVHRSNTVSGYGSSMFWVGTKEYEAFGDMRKEWYPHGIKLIPTDLSWMDDETIAKWVMDDGCRQRFEKQADRMCFSTNGFVEDDVRRLGDKLVSMYGISYHLVNDRGWSLVINSGRRQQITKFWEAIAPYIHPCLRYKIPEEYHGVPYIPRKIGKEQVETKEAHIISVSSVEITKKNFPSGRVGYDITTETGNYMAKGIIVHNSLGILYDDNCIATRGSFESDQAIHATELFRYKYSHYKPPLGRTMLFEIIYPTNRIVLDYGDMDDLVLLGAVEIDTGMSMSPRYSSWDGPKTMMFAYNTLQEVLDAPARSNAEGLVIHFFDTDERIKIKQDDYVALHKIISGLNERVVWEHISNGNELETLLVGLPDEFHVWVREVAGRLKATVEASAREVESAYSAILATLPEGYTKKDFAMVAKEHPRKSELFARHVGKSYLDKLWGDVYPDAKKSPRNSDSALDN